MLLSDCYLACITGATSGLGASLAYLLAQKKIPLMLTGTNEEQLKKLETSFPDAKILKADLATPTGRNRVVAWINKWKPNLIINNAGIGLYGPALEHDAADHTKIFSVNTLAPFEITHGAAEMLQDEGRYGVILNVASAAAHFPYPNFASYAASKAAVVHFSKSLDYELRPDRIRVLVACPGQIATDFRSRASKGKSPIANKMAMAPLAAAKKLLRQVEKEIPCTTFGPGIRLGLFLLRLLPKNRRLKALAATLRGRY